MTVALAVIFFAIGGLPWVVWGIFARLVFTYHCTWLVNSASHAVGYQSFKTGDRSTNSWWVALLTFGEGWHNNHHAFPFSARHGLRWFEIDPTWITIKAMSWLRLAKNVKLPTREMMDRLKATPASDRKAA
jgi:stearoyl-CoA desaturase (delta-9 desaturase)